MPGCMSRVEWTPGSCRLLSASADSCGTRFLAGVAFGDSCGARPVTSLASGDSCGPRSLAGVAFGDSCRARPVIALAFGDSCGPRSLAGVAFGDSCGDGCGVMSPASSMHATVAFPFAASRASWRCHRLVTRLT